MILGKYSFRSILGRLNLNCIFPKSWNFPIITNMVFLRCSSRQVEFCDVIWIYDKFLPPDPVQVNVVEFALDVIEELQDQPGGLQRLIQFQVSNQQNHYIR